MILSSPQDSDFVSTFGTPAYHRVGNRLGIDVFRLPNSYLAADDRKRELGHTLRLRVQFFDHTAGAVVSKPDSIPNPCLKSCTVGRKSHDPCFHAFLMGARIMTFVTLCTYAKEIEVLNKLSVLREVSLGNPSSLDPSVHKKKCIFW